jgi:hypothetical protein
LLRRGWRLDELRSWGSNSKWTKNNDLEFLKQSKAFGEVSAPFCSSAHHSVEGTANIAWKYTF